MRNRLSHSRQVCFVGARLVCGLALGIVLSVCAVLVGSGLDEGTGGFLRGASAQHDSGHTAGHQGGAYRGKGRAGRGSGGGHFGGARPSTGRHLGRPDFHDDVHDQRDHTVEERVFHSGGHKDSLSDIHGDSHEGGADSHESGAHEQPGAVDASG